MADFITVLSHLADGQPHSVGELALAAGLSRDQIRAIAVGLFDDGLGIEVSADSVTWHHPVPLLDADRVALALTPAARAAFAPIRIVPELDSTSTYLVTASAATHGMVCAAERQTGGRGRRGNRWLSAPCGSLCFSLRWHFASAPAALGSLSLAVGIAVASVLRERLGLPAGVKWPNDIYIDERKLGGVLVELPRVSAQRSEAVIGIGLNVMLANADDIEQQWTSLHQHLMPEALPDRNDLLAWLLNALALILPDFQARGGSWVQANWEAFDITFGREVAIHRDHEVVRGVAAGIDESFRFLLCSRGNMRSFHSGDVSLRW